MELLILGGIVLVGMFIHVIIMDSEEGGDFTVLIIASTVLTGGAFLFAMPFIWGFFMYANHEQLKTMTTSVCR